MRMVLTLQVLKQISYSIALIVEQQWLVLCVARSSTYQSSRWRGEHAALPAYALFNAYSQQLQIFPIVRVCVVKGAVVNGRQWPTEC